MKVKVRAIIAPYTDARTESLQAILRNHATDRLRVRIGTRQLYDIMDELVRRREASGEPFRSDEEALAEFRKHYMPPIDRRRRSIRINLEETVLEHKKEK